MYTDIPCDCGRIVRLHSATADAGVPCPGCGRIHRRLSPLVETPATQEQREQAGWQPIVGAGLAILLLCLAIWWALLATGGAGGGGTGTAGGHGVGTGSTGAGSAKSKAPSAAEGGADEGSGKTDEGEAKTAGVKQPEEQVEKPEEVEPEPTVFAIGPLPSGGGQDPGAGGLSGAVGRWGQGDGKSIFDHEGSGGNIVYVIDRSSSMAARGRLAVAKRELEASLRNLEPDQKFCIFFYNTSCVAMPGGQLLEATPANVERMIQWMSKVQAAGGTAPMSTVRQALDLKSDTMWLLSDGEFYPTVVPAIKSINRSGRTHINTIAFDTMSGSSMLREIADQNDGIYRAVP